MQKSIVTNSILENMTSTPISRFVLLFCIYSAGAYGESIKELEAKAKQHKARAEDLIEKRNKMECHYIYNFKISSKISENLYEIQIIEGQTSVTQRKNMGIGDSNQIVGWNPVYGVALLETTVTKFESAGLVDVLFVHPPSEKKIKLKNGFDKNVKVFKQNTPCENITKLIQKEIANEYNVQERISQINWAIDQETARKREEDERIRSLQIKRKNDEKKKKIEKFYE